MDSFRIPFKRKPPPEPPKKKKLKGQAAGTKLKAEPGVPGRPILIRTVASWPYRCGHCKQLSDHPNSCAKCGVRFAMEPSPYFNPEAAAILATSAQKPVGTLKLLTEIMGAASELPKRSTGLKWLDKVMGGGIVPGKVYLIAGGPGTGKSTCLLQALVGYADEEHRCLYISGEEDESQIANRAVRLKGIQDKTDYIDLYATRDTGEAAGAIRAARPSLTIVDSLQEIGDEELETNFGGAKQVDNLMSVCIEEAKKVNSAIIFVCQVTKSGDPAGPKRAEHKTDCNLKIEAIDEEDIDWEHPEEEEDEDDDDDEYEDEEDEGNVIDLEKRRKKRERQKERAAKKKKDEPDPYDVEYRLLKCDKNRFAPANQSVVLRMAKRGLVDAEKERGRR